MHRTHPNIMSTSGMTPITPSICSLQPYEKFTDVTLSFMDFTDNGFQPGEPLYTLAALIEDKPLVIGVVFYGDFTTFGLSFHDASGSECRYMIYSSGRNGSVVLQKMDT